MKLPQFVYYGLLLGILQILLFMFMHYNGLDNPLQPMPIRLLIFGLLIGTLAGVLIHFFNQIEIAQSFIVYIGKGLALVGIGTLLFSSFFVAYVHFIETDYFDQLQAMSQQYWERHNYSPAAIEAQIENTIFFKQASVHSVFIAIWNLVLTAIITISWYLLKKAYPSKKSVANPKVND